MTDSTTAVIDALATHRLVRLAIEDEITEGLRSKLWETHPPHTSKLGYLVTCPWCSGMWIGAGVAVARTLVPKLWGPVAYALAASSAAGIIEEKLK